MTLLITENKKNNVFNVAFTNVRSKFIISKVFVMNCHNSTICDPKLNFNFINVCSHRNLSSNLGQEAGRGLLQGPNIIKLFVSVIYKCLSKARAFVPGKPL